jgi:hypothetical protein
MAIIPAWNSFLIGKSQMAPVGWAARLATLSALRFIPDEMN